MSGSIPSNPVNYSVLFPVSTGGTATNLASSLLSISYGYGAAAGVAGSGGNPVLALQTAQANQTKDVTLEAQQPQVARDIATFTKAVQTATSPAQLLNDPTVLKVLLTANGLGSQSSFTALAQKALLSNVNDPKGLANQLSSSNPQWLSTAQTFDFANKGLSILQTPKVLSAVTNGYAEVLWRQSLDAQTPGLSSALDFIQNGPKVTSALQILGDPILRDVVTTAYGIPQQIAFQDINAQEKAITDHLDISKLQDPKFVQNLADLYLTAKQNSASQTTSGTTSLLNYAVQAQSLVA
jgi:hypothetical protein